MICSIYRSRRKPNTYVYVLKQEDRSQELAAVPPHLHEPLGELEHSMDLDLAARDRLARVDVEAVKKALQEKGLYIQMPPGAEELAALDRRLSQL